MRIVERVTTRQRGHWGGRAAGRNNEAGAPLETTTLDLRTQLPHHHNEEEREEKAIRKRARHDPYPPKQRMVVVGSWVVAAVHADAVRADVTVTADGAPHSSTKR